VSLYKRNTVWWYSIYIDGVRHCESTGTSNRRKAEQIERQRRDELNDTRHRLPQTNPDITFGALATRFIAERMSTPYSVDRLQHLLPFFADISVRDTRAMSGTLLARTRNLRWFRKHASRILFRQRRADSSRKERNNESASLLRNGLLAVLYGCSHRVPVGTVEVIDTSLSVTPRAEQATMDAARAQIRRMERGDILILVPITGDELNDAGGRLLRLQAPTTRESYDADLRRFRMDAATRFAAWAAEHGTERNRTDILGSLDLARPWVS
jgi:hypothetical protein